MNRDAAWALVREWTSSPNLRRHMLAVEAAMRAYAERFGAAEAGHPFRGVEALRAMDAPDVITRAVLSHADYSGVRRESLLEKALFACDELTGVVIAVALVKPGRSLAEVDVASVRRKMKDKAFARAVNREDILHGAEEVGVPLDEHIGVVLGALQQIADSLDPGAVPRPAE